MTPDTFSRSCQKSLADLDTQLALATRELAALGAARPANPDAIAAAVALARQAAEAVNSSLTAAATAVGDPLPVWDTRDELEAIVRRLTERLGAALADARRERLRSVAASLVSAQVIHPRWRKVVPALEKLRLQAAAEVQQAADGAEPPELPGPADGSSWLAWAWDLPMEQVEDSLAGVRATIPALAEVVLEVSPEQWVVMAEPVVLPVAPEPSGDGERRGVSPPVSDESTPAPPTADAQGSPEIVSEPEPPVPVAPTGDWVEEPAVPTLELETPPAPPPPPAQPKVIITPVVVVPPPAPPEPEPEPVPPPAPTVTLPPEKIAAGQTAVWQLLDADHPGLAAHLADSLHRAAPAAAVPPGYVLRAVSLSPCLRHQTGDVARWLDEQFSHDIEKDCYRDDEAWNRLMRVLLTAACLRSALLAPNIGGVRILKSLRFDHAHENLFHLCKAAWEFADGRLPLDLHALKRTQDKAAWDKQRDDHLTATKKWIAEYKHKTMKLPAATDLWRNWLTGADGFVKRMLDPVIDPKFGDYPAAKREHATIEVGKWVANFENPTWVTKTANVGRLSPFVGDPMAGIIKNCGEAVKLARKWLELEQTRPVTAPDDERVRRAGRFRQELNRLRPLAEQDLDRTLVADGSTAARAAVKACRAAIAGIASLFEAVQLVSEEGCSWRALNGDLLRIPSVELNETGELPPVPDEKVEPLVDDLTRAASGLPAWPDAYRTHSEATDHLATGLILERADLLGVPPDQLPELGRKRDAALAECRKVLGDKLNAARRDIEEAVAFGLIKETQRTELLARVRGIEGRLWSVVRFRPEHATLAEVKQTLLEHRKAKVEEARARVAAGLAADNPAIPRISEVLDKGDVFTANEYLDMALRGIELPDATPGFDYLVDFFDKDTGRIKPLEEFIAKNRVPAFTKFLRKRENVGGMDLSSVPGQQRDQAAGMLDAWATMSQQERATPEGLKTVLSALGLSVTEVIPASGPLVAKRERYEVKTELVRDRSLCPLPVFGSEADGKYRLLCIWGRPSEQEVLSHIGSLPAGPVIVFYFGWMTPQRRRDLARLRTSPSQTRRSFLLLDDLLLAYLCGERGVRLPVFILCTMPFSHNDPYHVTASLVYPEMFYGRQRERDEILSATGSCFIYGGRQLGKTALLRDAERTFNRTTGQVAMWLDLKDARVGYGRDLWQFLLERLKRKGIVPDKVPVNVGPDRLLEHVEEWLNAEQGRRIVLLLDEADQFLVQDSDGGELGPAGAYARVTKLKGLMDRTNRRFKVVFAGLHNVQRTTRLENHPLAHYGEPICIGPLLDNGEWREARALIGRPFAALGYRFASPDLITRILSHTNYYPSLIQLYCNHLLRHVSAAGKQMFDPKISPPYLITEEHVDAAYQNEELRKAIRDRFTWTLQLDQRYEVLANVIALHALEEDPAGGATGLSVADARTRAMGYWPDGFRDGADDTARPLSEQAVQALLDEMVGLGVLRRSGGRFALRNPNVMLLMGTEEEIAATLVRDREKSLDQIPPTHFRSPIYDDAGHVRPDRRSPLSATQESELRRLEYQVSVLFGTNAGGLAEVRTAAEQAFGKPFFRAPVTGGRESFDTALEKLGDRKEDGTTLLLVEHTCGWEADWVKEAVAKLFGGDGHRGFKSGTNFVHILFLADPAMARTLTADPKTLNELRDLGVRVMGLEPWHDAAVRQWLEDGSFGPTDKPGRAELRAVTGNWPQPLADFYRACQKKGGASDHLAAFKDELAIKLRRDELLRAFGLDVPGVLEPLVELARCKAATTVEELAMDFDPKLGEGGTAAVLRWADVLRLADQGEDGWRPDPFVASLLLGGGK